MNDSVSNYVMTCLQFCYEIRLIDERNTYKITDVNVGLNPIHSEYKAGTFYSATYIAL